MRLLLLEQNRYHALLIERIFAVAEPNWVLTSFRESEAALSELATNNYSLAMIDLASLDGGPETLQELIQLTHSMPLIILASRSSDLHFLTELRVNQSITTLIKSDGFTSIIVEKVRAALSSQKLIHDISQGLPAQESRLNAESVALTARTLSHEINNPLMAILGMTELLQQTTLTQDPSTARKLAAIHSSAIRIKETLHQLSSAKSVSLRQTVVGEYLATSNSTHSKSLMARDND